MKLPSWMKCKTEFDADGKMIAVFTIRKWHPAFWLFVLFKKAIK